MSRLLGLLVLVFDVVALVDLWRGNKDTEKKILWTIAILVIPFVGAAGYFVVGKR
ncbi:MAG: PLD nuclease N-terminal domain-containing protein [Cyclobacteriaceae bacterium]|jgi:hypothetical protein|nr:PLD nuclease N-terminal domain-containing protein [Cyclobacteriaceae bacterium]